MAHAETADSGLCSTYTEEARLHSAAPLKLSAHLFEESRLPAILNRLPGLVWTTDSALRLKAAYGADLTKVGLAGDRVVGQHLSSVFSEEGAQSPIAAHRAALSGQRKHFEIRRGNRTYCGVVEPFYDSDENLVGTMATAIDLSEQRHRERERARRQEEDKSTALRRFAGGIAHNFNNLLTVILGYAHMAKAHVPSGNTAARHLEQIESAGESLAALTSEITNFGEKQEVCLRPLALTPFVESLQEVFRQLVPDRMELQYVLSDALPDILSDTDQLRKVLLVLVANASEAIGSSAGTIVISTDLVHADRLFLAGLDLAGDVREGSYVRLRVADTGCGLEPAARAHLFEPFFSTKFTGRGMGLAAAHGIVAAHQGLLAISSVPDVGTTFHVLFPCKNEVARSQSGR